MTESHKIERIVLSVADLRVVDATGTGASATDALRVVGGFPFSTVPGVVGPWHAAGEMGVVGASHPADEIRVVGAVPEGAMQTDSLEVIGPAPEQKVSGGGVHDP
jgi:hypothetical protein